MNMLATRVLAARTPYPKTRRSLVSAGTAPAEYIRIAKAFLDFEQSSRPTNTGQAYLGWKT